MAKRIIKGGLKVCDVELKIGLERMGEKRQ